MKSVNVNKVMGERVKIRREALGITQQGLAEEMDTDQRVISKWETGKNAIQCKSVPFLAETLECDIEYLFGETAEDCPTREIDSVTAQTGLSPSAVLLLQSKEYKQYSDIVSALVEHPEFLRLCGIIRQLQNEEGINKAQADNTIKYISENLKQIANDSHNNKPYPKIDIKLALYSGAKDCFVRILDSIAEEEK